MLWLTSSHLTGFDFLDLAKSSRYVVYYRRYLHNIMRCIEFSKLSPDINQSVAKSDIVNSVLFTMYKRESSQLLDSVIEQFELP